jgi:hypothetical protein
MSAIVGSCVDSRRNAPASFDVANSSSTIGINATAFKRTNRLIMLDLQIGHLMLGTAADDPRPDLAGSSAILLLKDCFGQLCVDAVVSTFRGICRSLAALSSM